MLSFDYHLLGSVGEEALSSSLGFASDTIEIQLQQEMLVWDFIKGFPEVR